LWRRLNSIMKNVNAYQDQRGIIVSISSIDVNAFKNLLLTHFQIPATTCIAEDLKVLAEIQWIFVFEISCGNGLCLIGECGSELVLIQNHQV